MMDREATTLEASAHLNVEAGTEPRL